MTPREELQHLLNLLVDQGLSESEEQRLADILRATPETRHSYLQFMQLHADLLWSQSASAAEVSQRESAGPTALAGDRARSPSYRTVFAGTIAAITLVAALWTGLERFAAPPDWATVVSVTGAVSYRGEEGEQLVAGLAALPAGELLLKGDSAALQLRLTDGTLISVNGEAQVVVDQRRPREIHLRRGSLTAEVQPQTPGEPLQFVTPTARVDVLGTVLSLSADSEKTRVHIDSGTVRVVRLVDGRSLEISGHESCVASLNSREELVPIPGGRRTPGFVHEFSAPPPERWKGVWLPPFEGAPARVASVPCVMGQRLDGEMQPVIHYGITLRPAPQIELGALPEDARLILTYRVRKPNGLYVMISAHTPDGRFAGNFSCKFDSERGERIDAAFQRVAIRLSEFQALQEQHPELRAGDEPSLILMTSFGEDVGLEFSRVEIAGAPGMEQ